MWYGVFARRLAKCRYCTSTAKRQKEFSNNKYEQQVPGIATFTMTIQCLAIVGKNNEPLYLCDCNFDKNDSDDRPVEDIDDVFGFTQEASKGVENNLSLDNEVRLLVCAFFGTDSLFSPTSFAVVCCVVFNACSIGPP